MKSTHLLSLLCVAAAAVACSAPRSLSEGEYALDRVDIKVDQKQFPVSELTSYLRQKPTTLYERVTRGDFSPDVYDPQAVEGSITNMLGHLEYIGYYGSHIESRVAVKGQKVRVTYFITLGKRYSIRSIDFDVPQYGDFPADFEADRPQVTIRPGQYLSEQAMEAETDRSVSYLRNRGYYALDKSYYRFEADTLSGDGTAAVTMHIQDHTRTDSPDHAVQHQKYTLGDIRIHQPAHVPIRRSVLEDLNTLRPGQLFSERRINTAYSRLSTLPVLSSVHIATTPQDDGRVDCDITLRASGFQGVKLAAEVSGNSTGLMGLSPQLSYFHRNIFHGGELLNISIKDNAQFKVDRHLRLRDDMYSNEFSATAGIRFPKTLGLPNRLFRGPSIPHTDINVSFSYQDRPEYKRTRIATTFGYTGNWGPRLYYQFYPFQANIVRMFSIDESFQAQLQSDRFMLNSYSDHFDMGVGGTLYYTTNTSAVPTTPYHYYRFHFNLSGNVLSLFNGLMPTDAWGNHTIWNVPYSQYALGELQVGRTFRFGAGERQALAYRLVGGIGLAYANTSAVPFERQFYCGGADSMRGWQVRSLGPGNAPLNSSFSIPSQSGDMKLEADVEYRFPLYWKLEGAAFMEVGNVFARGASAAEEERFSFSRLPHNLGADWGLGLRLNVEMILLRIDVGFKLHDPAIQQGSRLVLGTDWLHRGNYAVHFGVGYPF